MESDYIHVTGSDSCIGVLIGWYPLKNVLKVLRNDQILYKCAVIGNLFNPNMGVELLIRNLLHNPQISKLIIFEGTSQDNTVGSLKSFVNVLKNKEEFLSSLNMFPLLDIEDYQQMRQISIHPCTKLEELKTLLSVMDASIEERSTRFQVSKPIQKQESVKNYQGRVQSQYVEAETIDQAHQLASHRVLINGYDTAKIRELHNLNICVVGEVTNINALMDKCTDQEIEYINSFVKPGLESINYNYGYRLRYYNSIDLIETAIEKLRRKPQSLATMLPIFQASDLTNGDSPCLTSLWLRIQDGNLLMFASFRSNDIWKAWKSNCYGLRGLQIYIAESLGLDVGYIHTNSLSAHIYQIDLPNVNVDLRYKPKYTSAVGSFTIYKNVSQIMVIQTNSRGEFVHQYIDDDPLRLIRDIAVKNPTIEPDHIGYLGIEFQKVKLMINDPDSRYIQDLT